MRQIPGTKEGFTLIEFLVAVGVFTVVMLISVGALLTMIDASRKTQSLESVVNNLNFALEGMTRNMRTGSNYSSSNGDIVFENQDGDIVTYRLDDGIIYRRVEGGIFTPVTASEVVVEQLSFTVTGQSPTDQTQPRVLIVVRAHVGEQIDTRTDFNIQTLVSQRITDG